MLLQYKINITGIEWKNSQRREFAVNNSEAVRILCSIIGKELLLSQLGNHKKS